MILNEQQWNGVMDHCRNKLYHYFDPTSHFVENTKWRDELEMPHKGFYVGVVD
ncbi:hypothetical protein LCGC14_1292670, partial [marine sediment metagenome]